MQEEVRCIGERGGKVGKGEEGGEGGGGTIYDWL